MDGVSRKGMSSLEVILEEVRIERAAQLQHFDALDAKAGIVLGFSGAVAALAPSRLVVVGIGRLIVVIAALSAIWASCPELFSSQMCTTFARNISLHIPTSPD